MSATFDVTGLLKGIAAGGARAVAAAAKASEQFTAVAVVGVAQTLVPVETGALAASGVTEPATVTADKIEVQAGFNTSYAAAVHEILTARHEQGQAKYLEAAMSQAAPQFAPHVAAAVAASGGNA